MRKQKLLALITIICGSSLEIWYYYARFTAEGTSVKISVIQSISLTAFLMVAFLLTRKKKGWIAWLIVVPLAFYSIFNTASGNRQSLIIKAESEIVAVNQDVITELEKKLERKKAAYEEITGLKSNSFDSIQEMARWKTAVGGVNEEIKSKESEIDEIENQIIELKNPELSQASVSKIYDFYSGFLPISSDALQMGLQFMLSFFIALMSPSALLLWPQAKKESNWTFFVTKWVNVNWIGIRNGTSDNILTKETFLKWNTDRAIDFGSDQYDRIKKAAGKAKVVDNNRITINNEKEAIEAILKIIER